MNDQYLLGLNSGLVAAYEKKEPVFKYSNDNVTILYKDQDFGDTVTCDQYQNNYAKGYITGYNSVERDC